VPGEETGERVEQGGQERGVARQPSPREQKRANGRQQTVKRDLKLDDLWRDADQEEWPVQWIPRPGLRIGEERKS